MWKYLRIAVTAVSLFVCVLLIALWVRSYSTTDFVSSWFITGSICATSELGSVEFLWDVNPGDQPVSWESKPSASTRMQGFSVWHFYWHEIAVLIVRAPNWFWFTITATIAALPWIKWHFSLRTLLIVMTLFALFFGAIAMSMRG